MELVQAAIWTVIMVAGPCVLAAMVVGIIIALLQALTQVQEITLTFVPKIMAIFVVAMFPNFGRAKVVGHSMEPQYQEGDPLVILKTFRIFSPLKSGDIIVIRKKSGELAKEELVKRVVFVQSKEGNAPFPKSFITSRGPQQSDEFFPWFGESTEEVPPGGVIVVGDNFDVSQDSRDPEVGVIKDDEIVGKVLNH